MLFYIDKKGKILLHPDVYKVEPFFRKLSSDQVCYLILRCDYKSQFHLWPTEERKRKAKGWVFGMDASDPKEDPKIAKAIKRYDELQYNDKEHTKRVYQDKKRKFELVFQHETDPIKSDKIMDSINKLQHAIEKIDKEILTDTQTSYQLKGKKQMTLIEKLLDNEKLAEMRRDAIDKLSGIDIKNDLPTNSKNKKENLII